MKRNNNEKDRSSLTIFIADEVKTWLKHRAVTEDISMGALIQNLVEEYKEKVEGGHGDE